MAYDFNHDVLYWTTGKGLVVQLSPKSEDNELTDLQELLTGPASIGVDYIGKRLYWIDTMTAGQLEVRSLKLTPIIFLLFSFGYKAPLNKFWLSFWSLIL